MFLALLAMSGTPSALTPRVENVQVQSLDPGSCLDPEAGDYASLRVTWDVVNANPAEYALRLLENGVFKVGLDGDVEQWDKTITGAVEDAPRNPWTSSWVYRVEVRRILGNSTVSAAESEPWVQDYGSCGPRTGGVKVPK